MRPSKLLYYQDRPEYCDESLRLEVTCCYSDSSERPLANSGVKNSQGIIIIIIIITIMIIMMIIIIIIIIIIMKRSIT